MNQGYTTLDQIVREACMESDDHGMHNYSKFMLWAMEGLQEMRIDDFQEIKSILVTTSTIATIPFPVDMVKWTKIGEVSGDRVKVFTINNSIMLNHQTDCGVEQNNAKYKAATYLDINRENNEALDGYYFYGYGTSGAIYGYGNGTQGDGQFREDKSRREFQFSSQYASKPIVLEYVSTGLNPSGQSYIEESIRKAVKEYIFWWKTERDRSASGGEKDRAKYLYDQAARVAQRRGTIDLDTIQAILRKGYMQTPRG